VVVVTPGWGDAVQANKAGLMEIADVFVVNKADRAGASETVADLERMLSLRSSEGWRPPVITTVATTGEGVEAVREAIEAHQRWAIESGDRDRRRAARAAAELRRVVQVRLAERVDRIAVGDRWEQLRDQVADHRIDPWTAAEELLAQLDD
jgi:LAO/AO transport system kinase